MFVPYFNFYWIFVAIRGLAVDMNAYIKRHGLAVRPAGVKIATAYCILTIAGAVPFVGLLAFIVLQCCWIFLLGGTIARTAAGIAEAHGGEPGRRRSRVGWGYAAVVVLGLLIVTGLTAGMYFTWPKHAARSYSLPDYPSTCIAVSAEGKWIATESLMSSPRQVKVYGRSADGTISKKPMLTASVTRPFIMATAFSPDGKYLAVVAQDNDHPAGCTGPGDLSILEIATARKCLTVAGSPGQDGALDCVAFSRDGTLIATAFVDQTVLMARTKRLLRVRKADTGEVIQTLSGHNNGISSLSFSPDGSQLASGSQDRTVKVWDIASGSELLSFAVGQGFPHQVIFSPDGKLLATCNGLGVKVWNAKTGAVVMSTQDFDNSDCLAFSPDSRYLATGGASVKIWDISSQEQTQSLHRGLFPSIQHVEMVSFSADGKTFMAVSGQELIVWEVAFDKAGSSSHP
jgi:WD40 repeat protein